jgi:hypothetical protein
MVYWCYYDIRIPKTPPEKFSEMLEIQDDSREFWPKFSTATPALLFETFHCANAWAITLYAPSMRPPTPI